MVFPNPFTYCKTIACIIQQRVLCKVYSFLKLIHSFKNKIRFFRLVLDRNIKLTDIFLF